MARPLPILIQEELTALEIETQSLGSSTRSISSNLSFKEKLYGLLSPTSTEITSGGHDDVLAPADLQAKVEAIHDCLRGVSLTASSTHDDIGKDQIDLWHLRELALQPGGLLDPSLRKRAWPLLTGMTFLQEQTSSMTTTVSLSLADLEALQRDVPHTVWNVREHFVQQCASRDQEQASIKKVAVADEQYLGFDSFRSRNSSGGSERRPRHCKAGRMEQKIIATAVTSCLQTQPIESECFEDDRYHYFEGLHDLTSLLMINLESPSLSSLLLYVVPVVFVLAQKEWSCPLL